MIHAKAFQILHTEMLQQFLACRLIRKHPVVEFESTELITKDALKILLARPVVEHLLGREVA